MAQRRFMLAAALALVAFVLAGCVEEDTPPSFAEPTVGTVQVSAVATAADSSPQYLDEYGLFYSTVYDDIVAINGESYKTSANETGFIVRPGVGQIANPCPGTYVGAKQQGTLGATVTGLAPNTTYYFRFYTIGRDNDDMQWKYALQVASYRTASTDASLKSIKASAGKLSPKFSKSTHKYKNVLSRSKSKTKITVSPRVAGSKVRMKVSGGSWSTVKSKTVKVARGKSKTVYIKITATDRSTTGNYSVKISRKR